MANQYKRHKRTQTAPFTKLDRWVQRSEAWRALKPGPRALYIELKAFFNGRNNGDLFLSHRDAAEALNVSKNTIGVYYAELIEKGFIKPTQAAHLGSEGKGEATHWALTELALNGREATKDFARWTPEKPKTRPKKRDTPVQK